MLSFNDYWTIQRSDETFVQYDGNSAQMNLTINLFCLSKFGQLWNIISANIILHPKKFNVVGMGLVELPFSLMLKKDVGKNCLRLFFHQ